MLTDQEIIAATKPVLFVVRNENGSIRSYGSTRPDEPCEAYYADDPVFAARNLQELRERRCDEVDALHARKARFGMAYGGDRFELDDVSYGKITALATDAIACDRNMEGSEWEATAFVSSTNQPLMLTTPAQVIAFATAAKKMVKALFAKRFALKVMIRASEDPASIDINAGWPEQE